MTIQEALQIEEEFYMIQSPSEEDIFRYTEAMDFLIRETRQPRYMMSLGGYYYEDKKFDLALKYYEMAAELGDPNADVCLGYIWYYGRTGERNFEEYPVHSRDYYNVFMVEIPINQMGSSPSCCLSC